MSIQLPSENELLRVLARLLGILQLKPPRNSVLFPAGSAGPGMLRGTRGGSAEPLLPDVGKRRASEPAIIIFFNFFFPPVVLTLRVSD